jgi:hypothetical protein
MGRFYLDERAVKFALKKAREKVRRCVRGLDRDSLCEVVNELTVSFAGRPQWVARGLARYMLQTVKPLNLRVKAWLVEGVPTLGDRHASYLVWLDGDKYRCTCFTHAYGYVRQARICTHIAAVMFYRRQRRIGEIE